MNRIQFIKIKKYSIFIIVLFSYLHIKASDAYIMSYFGGANEKIGKTEKLYLAYSTDALNWTQLNNGLPVLSSTVGNKSIRDPYIFKKQDGKFVVMSTNSWKSEYVVFWDSEDLCTFTNERLIRMDTTKQHAWAPECIFDPVNKNYIVYWSGNVIYANTTTDFVNFSPAKEFFNPGYKCIDATIVLHKSTYYLIFKDANGKNTDPISMKVAKSKSLQFGSFEVYTPNYIADFQVEGPACIKDLKKDRWYLYYDYYFKGGIWGCSYTDDLESGKWTKMDSTQFSLPLGVRHGNAVKVTSAELEKIKNKWKNN